MKLLIAEAYLKTKRCMDMSHTTEVMAIFVIFMPILAKRPLDLAIRNVFFGFFDTLIQRNQHGSAELL